MDAPPIPPPLRAIAATAGSGGREDCWTEDATETLVEAWGERYIQLSRGNLRQKDWQDVAVAVNEHLDAVGRPRRTDIQCKNRIDTLKKKYKIEKSKRGPSRWRFFDRLDFLIAAPAAPALKKHRTPAVKVKSQLLSPLTLKVKNGSNVTPHVKAGSHSEAEDSSSSASSKSSADEYRSGDKDDDEEEDEEDEDEGDEEGRRIFFRPGLLIPKKRRWDGLVDAGRLGGGDAGLEGAFGELARAIVKFGEIYERVESSKQKQMIELEKQRMELTKELECQRMQMFMELQVGLEKIERPKFPSRSGDDS